MPELPEVDAYRRLAVARALGRRVRRVDAPDEWFLKRGLTAAAVDSALVGRSFVGARRIGKLLLLETSGDDGPVLGLRFGMTGRLVVDGIVGVDDLLYSSNRAGQGWDRFVVVFDDGGELRMRDPRRLGGFELDPDESALGFDAATLTVGQLRRALGSSAATLKARLMDQKRVAGIGNLIADEALWRAGLSPVRAAGSLSDAELRRLQRHVRTTVADLISRGGSHMGDLLPHRVDGGRCPTDGTPLVRAVVGTRTTWWCPKHQR